MTNLTMFRQMMMILGNNVTNNFIFCKQKTQNKKTKNKRKITVLTDFGGRASITVACVFVCGSPKNHKKSKNDKHKTR